MRNKKIVIYQLLVRLFGNKNTSLQQNGTIEQNGVGKFNDISPKALEEIRILGATHIYFTGILEHATMSDFTSFGIQPDDWRLVKGRAGSPFAIKDYFDVSPELAVDVNNRMKEFEEMLARTHKNGMKAIIDFIPNHVARGYHSESVEGRRNFFGNGDDIEKAFDPQNNFYYIRNEFFTPPADYHPLGISDLPDYTKTHVEWPAKVTGNNVISAFPSTNDWFETVKLNFGIDVFNQCMKYFDPVPKTWIYFREVLFYWISKGVDGFRCDMAEMVPVEFWSWIIPQVKEENADVIFIAEIYQPDAYADYIYKGQFDYLYDKAGLYDKLVSVLKDESPAEAISVSIAATASFSEHMLYFMENHDEIRIASQKFARNSWAGIPAITLCCTISKGPVMIYFGQEVGETADVQAGFGGGNGRTTIYDYWNAPEHQKWMNNGAFDGGQLNNSQKTLRTYYSNLLSVLNMHKAFYAGDLAMATENIETTEDATLKSRYLFSYFRYTDEERILVVLNFNREAFLKVNFSLDLEKWQFMNGRPAQAFKLTELAGGKNLFIKDVEEEKILNYGIEMVIPPSGALIYLIEEVN